MIEKDKELYSNIRTNYTMAEKLYTQYTEMKNSLNEELGKKYGIDNSNINSNDFKDGFIAGVKTLSALYFDF